MFAFRSRIFIVLLCLFSFSSGFANIIYVNINNPTPGTGTTWASAYIDLNLALAAANYGDQIWVAQGTYMPTNSSDRTKTFLIQGVISVYGGFTGVETTLGARNWTTNQTILSGDIGVAGDLTDNSYNVVTITNNGNSATLDGFTIQYGNGNQNYSSTTLIQPYNQAGGVLVVAGPGVYTGALIDHCVLNSNFGVYGGGICTYAHDAGSIIEVTIVHDLFKNNSSFFGGGVAWISLNGGKGLTSVESCIFNSNSSTTGYASSIAVDCDGSGSKATMLINNCTCYNNPAPLLYNLEQNGGTSSFYTMDCIMWQSGGPYSSPLSGGSNTHIQNCDLDLTTPGSANSNNDPLFVNAPGGDFHLQPCSPDIDVDGMPALNSNTDYGGNPRIQNNNIDYGAYESSKTVSPIITATPATYCQNSTANPIAVSAGTNILWYTTATGGTGSSVTPVPSTTTAGSTQYWVTQTLTSACESQRNPVTIKVNAQPAAPITSPVNYCQSTSATALTATGTSLLWYTVATGGTGTIIAPTPSTTTTGNTTWYVTQTGTDFCESPRTPLTVTIGAQAAAPTTTPTNYCQNSNPPALTATGTNLLWYTATTGGTGSSTAPVPPTSTVGNTTWYVSQMPAGSCESPRSPLTVSIGAQATAPTANPTNTNYCQNSISTDLTATGTNLLWYTAAIGGTGSSTAPVPSTTAVGSTTWYVSQTPGSSCESPRTPVTVTITAQATAPIAAPSNYCQNSNATALTATGTNLLWYTAATDGTGSATAPTPTTTTVGSTTWYVSQAPVGGCESPRTPVTVTIAPNPTPDFTWADACAGTSSSIKAVTGTPAPGNYNWDFANAATIRGSGAGPYEIVWNSDGVYTVTLTTTTGTCQNQAQHNVTVYTSPKVSINPVETPLCVGNSVTLTATGAHDFQWSPAADLSNPSISTPIAFLQNDILYTVTGTDANGCSATAQVLLQISADCNMGYHLPDAFTPNGDGHNDLFRMKTGDVPKAFSMAVFNRYGSKVFESRDINTGWDGTIGSNPAPTGAYVYIIVVTTSAGSEIKKQGTVMLIR